MHARNFKYNEYSAEDLITLENIKMQLKLPDNNAANVLPIRVEFMVRATSGKELNEPHKNHKNKPWKSARWYSEKMEEK